MSLKATARNIALRSMRAVIGVLLQEMLAKSLEDQANARIAAHLADADAALDVLDQDDDGDGIANRDDADFAGRLAAVEKIVASPYAVDHHDAAPIAQIAFEPVANHVQHYPTPSGSAAPVDNGPVSDPT